MKSARLPTLALITVLAMLFQSMVFAVEYSDTALSNDQLNPVLDGNRAVSLELGQTLPFLEIQAGGEVTVNDKHIVKRPWNSKSFENKGKIQLVQYVAANKGAARQNKPFNDSLIAKHFSSEQLNTTVIVHFADTFSLLKGLIVKKVAQNKVKHQSINFVIDDNSVGLQRWGMKNKSCAIIILDANGNVLFAKDGPLSETEIESTIELIEKQMS